MELSNGRLVLVLDDQSGELIRIANRNTGKTFLDATEGGRTDGRLFHAVVPSERWSSRYVNSHEADPPEIGRNGNGVSLLYKNLKARGEPTGVTVKVIVDLPTGTDEARFTLEVHNDGSSDVLDILFPWIGGWTGIGGKGEDLMVLGASVEVDPHGFPMHFAKTYARVHQRMQHGYPYEMYAPWIDLSGPGGGISYISYMERAQMGYVSIENLAGYDKGLRLAYGWVHPTVVRPGETWTTPTVGISVHDGDWHNTADRFRTWVDTWFKAPPAKRGLRESIGYQNVFFRGFDGAPIRELDTIPAAAAAGREYGVDQLVVWDFITLGNYAKHADLDILDYTDEERAIVAEGLKIARQEGTNTSALTNFRCCNPASSLYKNQAHSEVIRSYFGSAVSPGSPWMECWAVTHNNPLILAQHLGPFIEVLSPFANSFRERVVRQTRQYLDLGYTSMFFDQPFVRTPDYSRIEEGCRPEDTYDALQTLVKEVREILHQNNPDAFMIGELCDAYTAQHIDMWMRWWKSVVPATRAAYTIPQTMHSWVVDHDIERANHAFALGMYLCLCTHGGEKTLDDEPAFGEHVAALARLRKQCAERTVYSRFTDTRGIDIQTGDGIVAYGYEGEAGPSIIAASLEKAGQATVTVNREAFAHAGSKVGRMIRLDGSMKEVSGDAMTFDLERNDVVVWEL